MKSTRWRPVEAAIHVSHGGANMDRRVVKGEQSSDRDQLVELEWSSGEEKGGE